MSKDKIKPLLPSHNTRHLLRRDAREVGDWSYDMYSIGQLHAEGMMGEGERIAIIDTGLNDTHPDLYGTKVVDVFNYVKYEDEYDQNGHSSWIHGRLSAIKNGYGVIGFAPAAEIVILKVLDKNGAGDPDDIAKAIHRAIKLNCTFCNLSIGMPFFHQGIYHAINEANAKGMIVLSAAGNDGRYDIDFPGNLVQTVCIGSHNADKKISRFSDRGHMMDLFAPGEDVLSTDLGNAYSYKSGTSMATPTALAIWACIRMPLSISTARALKKYTKRLIDL